MGVCHSDFKTCDLIKTNTGLFAKDNNNINNNNLDRRISFVIVSSVLAQYLVTPKILY